MAATPKPEDNPYDIKLDQDVYLRLNDVSRWTVGEDVVKVKVIELRSKSFRVAEPDRGTHVAYSLTTRNELGKTLDKAYVFLSLEEIEEYKTKYQSFLKIRKFFNGSLSEMVALEQLLTITKIIDQCVKVSEK